MFSSAVPVVLDKNTAMYALHLYGGVGEVFETVDDVTGRTNVCTANDVQLSLVLNREDVACELGETVR